MSRKPQGQGNRCEITQLAVSTGYKKGCRCVRCSEWKRTAEAPRREKAKEVSRLWRLANLERSRENGKRWAAEHPDLALNSRLVRKYGITLETYNELLIKQDGLCAICGKGSGGMTSGKRLSVDHDHYTGRVRGLLCGNCNVGIGHLEGVLPQALEYLMKCEQNGEVYAE